MSEVFHEIQLEAALEASRLVVIRGRPIAASDVGPSEITPTLPRLGMALGNISTRPVVDRADVGISLPTRCMSYGNGCAAVALRNERTFQIQTQIDPQGCPSCATAPANHATRSIGANRHTSGRSSLSRVHCTESLGGNECLSVP